MSRTPRNYIKTHFFHVMVQGIEKSYIFNKEKDILYYINFIKKSEKLYKVKVVAYCIMNNHAHLLLNSGNIDELSRFMQSLNTRYAMYYNKTYNRVGYVFRDRYKSEGIYEEKQFYACMNYIYNNPIKAGICDKIEDYKFSNYIENLKYIQNNFQTEDRFIDIDIKTDEDIINEYINKKNVNIKNIIKKKGKLKKIIKQLKELKVSYRSMEKILNISRETLRRNG